ncbi:MAG: GldM family protein, partial [Bacteroidota bacterium]
FLEEILNRHKNDTAEYIDSPTDVVITWTVREFMQTVLKWKADKKIPNAASDFESRLENLQNGLRKNIRINIPGEYHGMISKDDILLVDSLTCSLEGFRVNSFNLTIANKTFAINNIFTKEIKDSIRDMITGDRLYIEDITIEIPDKTFRKVPSLILEIR